MTIAHQPHNQTQMILEKLGDNWLEHNRPDLGHPSIADEALEQLNLKEGGRFLEIGCSNGWRLQRLKEARGWDTYGIDPSAKAVTEAVGAGLNVVRGTADAMPWPDKHFDIILCGYCLSVINPAEMFKTVAEIDRVLANDGTLVIHDFSSLEYKCVVMRGEDPNLMWYFHWNYPEIFLGHPFYHPGGKMYDYQKAECITVISKDTDRSFVLLTKEPIRLAP